MSDETKVCVGCGETKDKEAFRMRQPACKECEADPSVYVEKTCSKCGEVKSIRDDFPKKGNACKKCYRAKVSVTRTKTCPSCEIEKDTDEFRLKQIYCKACEENPDVYLEKTCIKCEEVKSFKDDFSRGSGSGICRKCKSIKPRRFRICVGCEENKPASDYRRGLTLCLVCEEQGVICDRECQECHIVKSSDFFRDNRRKCLECERSYGRNYRRNTTKAKEWVENNKEKMAELQSKWYETNKAYVRKNESERKANDPVFRNIKNLRKNIGTLLHGKVTKSKSLATTRKNFLAWMADRFEPDMTLDNHYELWQVDHVLPLELFYEENRNYWCSQILEEEEAFDCLYTWYNTSPLYSKDNRRKGQTITYDSIYNHYTALGAFVKGKPTLEKDQNYIVYKRVIRRVLDALYRE